MKKIIVLLFIVPFLFSCHKTKLLNVVKIDLPTNGKEIVEGGNNYGFEVFKDIVAQENDENLNIMYSPLSLNSILYMINNGALGTTQEEIKEALEIMNIDISNVNETYYTLLTNFPTVDEEIILKIANSVWAKNGYTFQSNFSSIANEKYQAELQNLDFSAPASLGIINDWVKDKTDGKIEKIVDVLDMDLLIVNTLYFKGQWHTKFDKSLTQDRDFYLADSTKISVPTMELEDTIKFASAEKYFIVELPYSQGNFVMDLILPQNDNTTDSILDILPDFNSIIDDLTIINITVHLPKFEFGYENEDLANILTVQMPTAFSEFADFSAMITPNVFINKVIQKTYIKTDEEGTEAVAATGFSFMATSLPPSEINFNRPFIFIIREVSTNTVMFVGKVADPRSN